MHLVLEKLLIDGVIGDCFAHLGFIMDLCYKLLNLDTELANLLLIQDTSISKFFFHGLLQNFLRDHMVLIAESICLKIPQTGL